MSTVKTVKYQVGTDGTSTNNFTIYQPDPPDGTMRVGNGNADAPTDVMTVNSSGVSVTGNLSVTGNIPVNNTAPAFHAYVSSNQTLTSGVWTKAQMDTEAFDTNSNFDSTTNYRFTPTVAGYYHFMYGARLFATSQTTGVVAIYKNGSGAGGVQSNTNGTSLPNYNAKFVSGLVYMNGSTDYVEAYSYIAGTTPSIQAGINTSFFQGYLVRTV